MCFLKQIAMFLLLYFLRINRRLRLPKLNHLFDILNNLHLDEMKTYRISAVHAEMLKTLSRKLRMKEEEVIEEMIQERYNKKK